MEDLHKDNSMYIDTPFTLELKTEIKLLHKKLREYKRVTSQLNRVISHRDEVISLRDITIRRLRAERDTIQEREDSRLRRKAYEKFGNEPININIY